MWYDFVWRDLIFKMWRWGIRFRLDVKKKRRICGEEKVIIFYLVKKRGKWVERKIEMYGKFRDLKRWKVGVECGILKDRFYVTEFLWRIFVSVDF